VARRSERTPTWLDVAVHNVGIRRAARALSWAYSWAVVREALDGHEPTVEEVAEWWGMARRTAFRDQSEFREAFPSLDSPAAIYASAEAREAIGRHAEAGQKLEDWVKERRAKRETWSISVAQLPAAL